MAHSERHEELVAAVALGMPLPGAERAELEAHLAEAGLGHVSEIVDGDAPHTPRGCPFQAWSIAEMLRLTRAVLATRPKARA